MQKALTILWLLFTMAGCSGTRPELGIVAGRLRPCPPSPNCVNSCARDEEHLTQPLYYAGSSSVAWQNLTALIRDMEGAEIVSHTDTYLHADYPSALFRFVDDVEFLLDAQNRKIEVRSASRLGYYDFGVNRRRLQEIRRRFAEK
ncbi:MAG: DUF1499 domain-containing protein [Deltaproteobacteria bacterium]|jgi:uncharacterized protein (DUF1499 family)|nr:DUF1499 domain-containing protein [Deltaproteobacteria bacterium]